MNVKKFLVIILILVALVGVTFFIYNKLSKKDSVSQDSTSININESFADRNFGKATMDLIDKGDISIACSDAKSIVNMIENINTDFATNDNLSLDMSPENMTESMKIFEATMDIFGKQLEEKYSKDITKMEEVYNNIGNGFTNVFQVVLMKHLGIIDDSKVNEFIDVTYCGVEPKEGYISPLEMEIDPNKLQLDDNLENNNIDTNTDSNTNTDTDNKTEENNQPVK